MAIDASTKSTGIAIFKDNKLYHCQCITIEDGNVLTRIKKMRDKVMAVCRQYNPAAIVMQDVLPQDIKHNQSVFKALIYLQAALVMGFSDLGLQVELYAASKWRSLVGIQIGPGKRRNDLKTASVNLVKALYDMDVNDDISDAICLGVGYMLDKKKQSAF